MIQNWGRKKIKDICDKGSSNIAQNKITERIGEYPVFGASGMIQNIDFYHKDTPYIGVIKDGSGVGRVDIYPAYSSLLGTLQYITPKEGYSLQYIAYALKSLNLARFASGAAIPHIYFKDWGECEIHVPTLESQEKIVDELNHLSHIIDNKKKQLEAYDKLAQSIFYEMFGDPIANDKGWDIQKLENIGTIVTGSTPSTNDISNWDGDINWITPAELGVQLYYGETTRKLTEKGAKGLTLMPKGTVILSTRAPIGKLAITTVPMCCNQGFKNIICGDNINNIYLYYYLMYTMDKIKLLGRGVTFKEVSKSAIADFGVVTPPLTNQQQFAEKIEAIENQKKLVKKSLQEVEVLFNSRMDYYFN